MNIRKGPPYKVEFGKRGEKPPLYVSAILSDKVLIKGDPDELAKLNISESIPLTQSSAKDAELELAQIMLNLHTAGAVFSYDYKSCLYPSGFMLELQDKGILKESFVEISWSSPREWKLLTYELK